MLSLQSPLATRVQRAPHILPPPPVPVAPVFQTAASCHSIFGMPNALYHAHPSLSHSLMRYLEDNVAPIQFWHRSWLNPERSECDKTRSTATGNIFHDAMEDFPSFTAKVSSGVIKALPGVKFTNKPLCVGGARGGQLDMILTARQRLMAIPYIREAIETGQTEVSHFVECPLPSWSADALGQDTITLRCRPDLETEKIVLHWKTVATWNITNPGRLGRHIEEFRYLECLAHYRRMDRLRGIPERRHIMVMVQSGAPFEIRTIEPGKDWLDEKQVYGEKAVERFCELYGKYGNAPWPDFAERPQPVFKPGEGGSYGITVPESFNSRYFD